MYIYSIYGNAEFSRGVKLLVPFLIIVRLFPYNLTYNKNLSWEYRESQFAQVALLKRNNFLYESIKRFKVEA